jgi:ATP-dependent DNA helicase DinG
VFPDYPEWAREFRTEQIYAAERIVEAYRSGTRLVLLDGPTGVGKSLIPEIVRRKMGFKDSLYVVSGLDLQDQLGRDFEYMVDLRGRDNYPTAAYPREFHMEGMNRISCADCTYYQKTGCHFCPDKASCPYEQAVRVAMAEPQVVMNSSYFLTEANYVGKFSGRTFVTVDEADLMDQQLMRHTEIRVTRKLQRELCITAPRYSTKVESWEEWYIDTMAKLGMWVETQRREDMLEPDEVKLYNRCRRLWMQLLDAGGLDDLWTYVGESDDEIVFRPVEPSPWGKAKLFDHGRYWLLMSATLLSGDVMAEQLGWDADLPYEVIYLPSPFPKENRPIRFAPVADMGYKKRADELPRMIEGVRKVCELHGHERVMVHTHTYDNAKRLSDIRPGHTYTYLSARDRSRTLEDYKRDPIGVLVAASMERGIDLPDDLCRAVVITQLPFPYEGDKQIKKRIYGTGAKGYKWRLMETMRSIVQMSGRGVRHASDYCVTWVLDSRAPGFVDQCTRQGIAPKWWSEAKQSGPWLKVLGMERS